MVLTLREDMQRLTRWQPLKFRNHHFDNEDTARAQMGGSVTEARDLSLLRGEVHDRVTDEVDELERPLDPRRGEVSDRDRNLIPARLLLQLRDHRAREIDPAGRHAPTRQRQADPA